MSILWIDCARLLTFTDYGRLFIDFHRYIRSKSRIRWFGYGRFQEQFDQSLDFIFLNDKKNPDPKDRRPCVLSWENRV